MKWLVACLLVAVAAEAQTPQAADIEKSFERSCSPCHSLRIVTSQRLAPATWQKEVDKMIGWGATMPDRQVMIDFLAQRFSKTTAASSPKISADAVQALPTGR